MTLFDLLLVGHLAGDFLLQNRWMAENKSTRWTPLLVHITVYTLTVAVLALAAGGLSWQGIVLIFASHLLLDRREFVGFWTHHITGTWDVPWLATMVDQAWHVVVLALATLL